MGCVGTGKGAMIRRMGCVGTGKDMTIYMCLLAHRLCGNRQGHDDMHVLTDTSVV